MNWRSIFRMGLVQTVAGCDRGADDLDDESRHGGRARAACDAARRAGGAALRDPDAAAAHGPRIRHGREAHAMDSGRHGRARAGWSACVGRHGMDGHQHRCRRAARDPRVHADRRRRGCRGNFAAGAGGHERRCGSPRAGGNHHVDDDDRRIRRDSRRRRREPGSLHPGPARGRHHDRGGGRVPGFAGCGVGGGAAPSAAGTAESAPKHSWRLSRRAGPGVAGTGGALLHGIRLRVDARLQRAGPDTRAVRRNRVRHDAR